MADVSIGFDLSESLVQPGAYPDARADLQTAVDWLSLAMRGDMVTLPDQLHAVAYGHLWH